MRDSEITTIFVNGEQRAMVAPQTVARLLEELELADKRVAVEVNQEIVPRSRYRAHQLRNADRVEIVRAIGGG
ncbi:MAG: sulfur carrier protein ThiS [Gammaproteobacteria bacterium]|jgi:sulfur carrier protein|nr:sulfur carrier protein ThiS [Gammaproteobacteria bacterium]